MTFDLRRDGQSLGTFTSDGLTRQLDAGVLLPSDQVFVEKQNAWVPISDFESGPHAESSALVEYEQKFDAATPLVFVTPALIVLNAVVFLAMLVRGVSPSAPQGTDLIRWGADFGPLTL